MFFTVASIKNICQSCQNFITTVFNNVLLIAMQKPDASLVAGFSAWKNHFGRHVKKGGKRDQDPGTDIPESKNRRKRGRRRQNKRDGNGRRSGQGKKR